MNCFERRTSNTQRWASNDRTSRFDVGRCMLKVRIGPVLLLILLLAVTDAQAADPIRLTTDGALKRDPRFVGNEAKLVYCYDEGPDLVRMLQMKMDDRSITPVFEDAGNRHNLEPAWSLDGKWIAYTQCTGNLTARLVIHNRAENTDVFITHPGRGGTRSPTFSPDSKTVVYAFAETGPQQLWSVDTAGKNKKQLTEFSGITNWPTFTPDGKTIVFANSRENNYELYAVAADGSNEQRLTENTIMDIRPRVSPDGKRIAFVSTRDGNYEVYVMNLDGSQVQRITNSEERDDYPAWHSNGRQLVTVSERNGEFDLYLFDVEPTHHASEKLSASLDVVSKP